MDPAPSRSTSSTSSSSSSVRHLNSAFKPWVSSRSDHVQPPTSTTSSPIFSPRQVSSFTIQSQSSHLHSSPRQLSSTSHLTSSTIHLVQLYHKCNPAFNFVQAVPNRCLTKPSDPVHNQDWDNEHHDYILYVNDTLVDLEHSQRYVVLDILGTGTFGQVVKCRQSDTGQIVAVKVIKNQPAYFKQAWLEINILRMLHLNNPAEDTRHIVKLHAHFEHRGHLCLVFERLSINLYELLKQNSYAGIGLDLVRIFLVQILQALDVLVRSEIIHCDLKPENILVKALDTTELKIIDFGSACQLHYPIYSYVQSRFYRSPEVLLGWPRYDSKIDMWSLGCVAAELFLGIPLFPGQSEMNMIARIVEMLGDPPDRFLERCQYSCKFFNGPRHGHHPHSMHLYQLKTIEQYERENATSLPEWKRFFTDRTLRDIILKYRTRSSLLHPEELSLRESFVDLLSGMLKYDPRDRWSPEEAREHPFLSGEALPNGQPWTPPSRLRRTLRSRPVHIPAPSNRPDNAIIDNLNSASAPNFPREYLAQQPTHWPTFPNPTDGVMGTGQFQNAQYSRTFAPYGPNGAFSYAPHPDMGPMGVVHPMIGPGSYVPPSAVPPFTSVPMPRIHQSHHRVPSSLPPVGSYDGRPVIFADRQPPFRDHSTSLADHSAALGYGMGSTPLWPGSGLHASGSRESLTGTLHPSASRESLGFGRDPSATDLSEDGVFQFAPDEDSYLPANSGAPISALPPATGHSTLGIPGLGNYGVPVSGNSVTSPSGGLLPTGRRLSGGRSIAGPGTSPMVGPFRYAVGSHQQTRPARSSDRFPESRAIPLPTDTVMSDADCVHGEETPTTISHE